MPNDSEQTRQFALLLTEHQGMLRSFVLSLIPNHPNILDLLQDINIILWEKKDSFELGTNFRAWSFTVARHRVMNERKRLRRSQWLVFDDDVVETMADEDDEYSSEWLLRRHQALEHCMAKLRPEDRDLVEARYTSKAELQRYSSQTGRSMPSLSVTLHRLRSSLRRCIASRLAIGDRQGTT